MCDMRQTPCTLHDTVENGLYPYRCHRCDRCFVCGHLRLGYHWWLGRCGLHRTVSSPGVPVSVNYGQPRGR
jgi:hypothetical protein